MRPLITLHETVNHDAECTEGGASQAHGLRTSCNRQRTRQNSKERDQGDQASVGGAPLASRRLLAASRYMYDPLIIRDALAPQAVMYRWLGSAHSRLRLALIS